MIETLRLSGPDRVPEGRKFFCRRLARVPSLFVSFKPDSGVLSGKTAAERRNIYSSKTHFISFLSGERDYLLVYKYFVPPALFPTDSFCQVCGARISRKPLISFHSRASKFSGAARL